MKKMTSVGVDFDLKAIEIAKDFTIAKLNSSSSTSNNEIAGKQIGEMFLAIHSEVKKVFADDSSDK